MSHKTLKRCTILGKFLNYEFDAKKQMGEFYYRICTICGESDCEEFRVDLKD
jgi:hypothetical protein